MCHFLQGFSSLLVVGSLLIVAGCDDAARRPARTVPAPEDKGPDKIHIDTGKGEVDVDLKRDSATDDGKVDVDVKPGGGVDVDVDGGAIRDRIEERREKKTGG